MGSLVVTVVTCLTADEGQDVGQLGSAETSRLLVEILRGARLLVVG